MRRPAWYEHLGLMVCTLWAIWRELPYTFALALAFLVVLEVRNIAAEHAAAVQP